jgi:hypothetical protein
VFNIECRGERPEGRHGTPKSTKRSVLVQLLPLVHLSACLISMVGYVIPKPAVLGHHLGLCHADRSPGFCHRICFSLEAWHGRGFSIPSTRRGCLSLHDGLQSAEPQLLFGLATLYTDQFAAGHARVSRRREPELLARLLTILECAIKVRPGSSFWHAFVLPARAKTAVFPC